MGTPVPSESPGPIALARGALTDPRWSDALFERSPLPTWMFDRETLRFVAVNDAAVQHYGYSRAEFLSMTLADLRTAEDAEALRQDVRQAGGLSHGRLWQHRKKDGTYITVDIHANDFEHEGRAVRLVVAIDVTEREAAQRRLRETEALLAQARKMEAIGQLAGGIAHDFNNLLTVILSYSGLIEDTLDAGDERREDAAEIRRAAERAAGITRQLLAVSRHSIVAPRPIHVDQIVADFHTMLRSVLGERITLSIHRGDVPPVVADAGQIERVLLNLAANARDAMPDGGRLTIETSEIDLIPGQEPRMRRPGRHVVLSVTDTGTGIDPETRARIFDPFFTTKGPSQGTGLGLSIVDGIVAQAGGFVTVYSEPGHGTTFRVYLPFADDSVAPPAEPAIEAPALMPAMTVLVADDDREVREVACRILRAAGCEVLEAATASEALEVCTTHDGPIHAIVLDVVLSDARAEQIEPSLRALRPDLAVVLVSGYPAGALTPVGGVPPNLVAKPYSPTLLRSAVARAVAPSAAAAAPPSSGQRSRSHVLLAEDDPLLRRAVERFLLEEGYTVRAVASGGDARAALEEACFDVIVSDVHMPGGGGLDLLRDVRRTDLDVPVILMSGQPDVDVAARAIEYGVFRYLTKPVELDVLGRLLQQAGRAHALARIRREAFAVKVGPTGAVDRAGLEVRFERALDEIWLAYQPIVHARTGALFGVEALLRSDEPTMADPTVLLDAASQLGRLPLLGRRARALAASALVGADASLTMFVNLHPDDLLDIELVGHMAPLSRVARRTILEVTERAQLTFSAELRARLQRLRQLGFRLAIDDIGAGYSGLTTFAEVSPELVKVDMALIRGVHLSAVKQRTIGALCRLCHEGGTLVVAEGIESVDERDCVIDLGCDLLQGFLIARPDRALPAPSP